MTSPAAANRPSPAPAPLFTPAARAPAATARSTPIDQHIADPDAAQLIELLGDLAGRAIDRAVAVHRIGIAGRAIGTAMDGAVGPRRELQLAHPVGEAPFQRDLLLGVIVTDKKRAGDADLHRVKPPSLRLDSGFVGGDRAADIGRRGVLPEQEIVAALGDLADRAFAAGAHPDRRMRPLRGRRLDDDVVEPPVMAAMRERLVRGPRLDDDVEAFVEPRVGLVHIDAEAGEFIVAVALADAEIEPAAGQEIEGRGLLGEQYRVVPRQNDDGSAEP